MGETLTKIRDLTIIIGIYLYFIAWVYVHYYYQQFGISTESVKIDYSTYLMYSYNVATTAKFLYWVVVFLVLVVVRLIALMIITRLKEKKSSFKKLHAFFVNAAVTKNLNTIYRRYPLMPLIAFLVIIFPLLFKIARDVAINDYKADREDPSHLKSIQFVFRKDSYMMTPAVVSDSTVSQPDVLRRDIALIRNDKKQLLRLLGESEKYYIVLKQTRFNKEVGATPSGDVYFINKDDILLAKVLLRSF